MYIRVRTYILGINFQLFDTSIFFTIIQIQKIILFNLRSGESSRNDCSNRIASFGQKGVKEKEIFSEKDYP